MSTSPQAVSALLGKAGYRDAVRVSRSWRPEEVLVRVEAATPALEAYLVAALEDNFRRGWHRFEVRQLAADRRRFYVARP